MSACGAALLLVIHDSHHRKDGRCDILTGFIHVTVEFLHGMDDIGWLENVLTLYAVLLTFGMGSG